MRSSISSSNTVERVIPQQPWGRLALIAVLSALILTAGWELYWRAQGYRPTINDNKDMWAVIREKVDENPSQTVLIGSSRMLFDFSLDIWEERYDETPLQLSTVGTNASIYLNHLANDTAFRGTLLVGITPPLYFVPEGIPVKTPSENIDYFEKFSPAQRLSHFIGLFLDKNFAFIEQEDLALKKLLDQIPLSNREGAKIHPKLPPYFMELDHRRQGRMFLRQGYEEKVLKTIKSRWIPLFTPPPPPPMFTPEEFKKVFMEHVNKTLKQTHASVSKIQERGGEVILVRFPSSGKVRELEKKYAPRAGFWERIVKESGADMAIHFEDYPELSAFDPPEWSHLTAKDAKKFTRRLLDIIEERKQGQRSQY